jgi:hypothetical protein
MSQRHIDLAHVDGIDVEHVLFPCLSCRSDCLEAAAELWWRMRVDEC